MQNISEVKITRKNLIEARKKRNLTQQQVVELLSNEYSLKISRGHLSSLETGKRDPSIELAKALANLFNVSIDHLF
ncbi:MAG TPA: helix-turn-helix transcriptional regulator [Bacillota bacterium]|nr:helix-turn-helix transcriptional regulator [Bacillota bacterium]HOL09891.1 helix-turn-helix transcriptional regulator [Bacillota bacterium]